MKTVEELEALVPLFTATAQQEYDAWEQDEEGVDAELGADEFEDCDVVTDFL